MNKRRNYFLKQKLIGIFMVLIGLLSIKLLDNDPTFAILITPMGFMMLFSKNKILTNEYFFENEECEKQDEES